MHKYFREKLCIILLRLRTTFEIFWCIKLLNMNNLYL